MADPYPVRPLQHQPNFGSSPHLPLSFNAGVNPYGSRPPSRDPYQQMPVQYINENPPPFMYAQQQQHAQQQQQQPQHSQQSQYNTMQHHYNDNNMMSYNNGGNNQSFGPPHYNNQMPGPPHAHSQQQQQQYIPRQSMYDDYAMPANMHGRESNMSPQSNNYYEQPLHQYNPAPPTQRRTWAQPSYDNHMQQPQRVDSAWQAQKRPPRSDDGNSNWGSPQGDRDRDINIMQQQQQQQHHRASIHQNGDGHQQQQMYNIVHSSPIHGQRMSAGGQIQRQQSLTNLRETRSPNVLPKVSSAPTPAEDVMAPQSICFIGDEDDVDELDRQLMEKMQSAGLSEYSFPIHQLHYSQQQQQQQHFEHDMHFDDSEMMPQKVNITSGNLTYRIPSPQRPQLHSNSFQVGF